MKKVVVLSGAGMSAESGLKTFRDSNGLWEGHDVTEVASPLGWEKNKSLVLDFYNQRRRQLLEVDPNHAHFALARLEKKFSVSIVTQNVDDLHERSGSSEVIHLHGELLKVRSTGYPHLIYDWKKDLNIGDLCEKKTQLRPHIVWFGEPVPMLETAAEKVYEADFLIVVGTSMQVYPAASLIHYTKPNTSIFFVDPKPTISEKSFNNLTIVAETATKGIEKVVTQLIDLNF